MSTKEEKWTRAWGMRKAQVGRVGLMEKVTLNRGLKGDEWWPVDP